MSFVHLQNSFMSHHPRYTKDLADSTGPQVLRNGEPEFNPPIKVLKQVKKPPELADEYINSVIHGIGILFGLAAVPLLTSLAVRTNHIPFMVGTCIYGFCFLMVFTSSTFYHGSKEPKIKKALEILDHISIYFLIAGTYTPFILGYMLNKEGIIMLSILWGLVLAGIIFKIRYGSRYNIVSTIVYLLMGWMMVWTGGDFFREMPRSIVALILTGGVIYSIGAGFYLWEKWKWHHPVWHVLALLGAICHYAAVLLSVVSEA